MLQIYVYLNLIKMKRNLLIDCNNLLHRVFWVCNRYDAGSVPKMFFTCVKNYMSDYLVSPDGVYLAWDKKLHPDQASYRTAIDGIEYKATRDKEKNAKVYAASVYVRNIGRGMGLCNIYPGCLEADDVIAYLSLNLDGHSTIVSVDQDMLQLISGSTDVFDPVKKRLITEKNFQEFFPVALTEFIHYKAIMGDKSDNIPGIPKVGPKRAATIVKNGISLKRSDMDIYTRNLKLIDLRESLLQHSDETNLYKQQLDYHKRHRAVSIDTIHKICKDIECYDFPSDYIDFYTTSSPQSQSIISALS